MRRLPVILRSLAAAAIALTLLATVAGAAPCPPAGGTLRVTLEPSAETAGPLTALIAGTVTTASCDADSALSPAYFQSITCRPDAPETCSVRIDGLQPGAWVHRVAVTAGEALGQAQARTDLVLDATAGTHAVRWPLYRSVHTVTSLDDALDCAGCLRAAITAAEAGAKPALVQFAGDLTGTVRLDTPLPPLAAGDVTIDGIAPDGTPATRTIDGHGLNAAALRLTGARNTVIGLRAVNVGGDSDVLLLDGAESNDNLLDLMTVVGRSSRACGTDGAGCIINGVCREPSRQNPRGVCGDDGIAIRDFAGTGGANLIRRCQISAAHDKGVKASDRGVAIVEDSIVFANTDGGLQATLSGTLMANRNVVFSNDGTISANGLAANGAAIGSTVPARLETRGNLSIANALRGISVRSLSRATLRDDFVCGNGTAGRGAGFGIAVLDAAATSAALTANGLAIVHNVDGGVIVADTSTARFGLISNPGNNAIAFNGMPDPPVPANFRNVSAFPVLAAGNAWEHCGLGTACDIAAVQSLDISAADAPVAVDPALATRQQQKPRIDSVEPPFAAAGSLVRIYGSGFDAIEGAGPSCDQVATANTCSPLQGNCVLVDRTPAEVIAATPTMLVMRAPFTCVAPLTLSLRTHWSHGFVRVPFCTVADADAG